MRSLLNRFLMRVEFSLQHSQFSMLFTNKQQNLCQNLIEEKEKRNLALEGSIMQILLSTQRHWRRSNEMLQGRLLDNSFTEKSKVLWVGSQYVTFLSLSLSETSPLLLLLLTIISRLEKADLRLRLDLVANICQTWQRQSIDSSENEAFHFQQIIF